MGGGGLAARRVRASADSSFAAVPLGIKGAAELPIGAGAALPAEGNAGGTLGAGVLRPPPCGVREPSRGGGAPIARPSGRRGVLDVDGTPSEVLGDARVSPRGVLATDRTDSVSRLAGVGAAAATDAAVAPAKEEPAVPKAPAVPLPMASAGLRPGRTANGLVAIGPKDPASIIPIRPSEAL